MRRPFFAYKISVMCPAQVNDARLRRRSSYRVTKSKPILQSLRSIARQNEFDGKLIIAMDSCGELKRIASIEIADLLGYRHWITLVQSKLLRLKISGFANSNRPMRALNIQLRSFSIYS